MVSNLTESSYIDLVLNQFTDCSTYYVVTGMAEAGEMITSNDVEIASDANKLNSVLSGEIVLFETPGPVEDTIGAAGYKGCSVGSRTASWVPQSSLQLRACIYGW